MCRYIGEGERWIVVFVVRFCLKVGIKIKFRWRKKRRPQIACSSCKQILFNCEVINHVES